MPSITKLPKETVLEITKLLVLKDAMTLLRTCKTLHDIVDYRAFWTDQISGQMLQFKAWIQLDFQALTARELRQIATKPYRFKRDIVKKRLRGASLTRLKADIGAFVVMADIVPGGEWIVTLTVERESLIAPHGGPCLRLWCIAAPVMEQFGCRATKTLPTALSPTELCVHPDEVEHYLLLFVCGAQERNHDDKQAGLTQVFRIDLSAANPQFLALAILPTPRVTGGILVHDPTVLATSINAESHQTEEVV